MEIIRTISWMKQTARNAHAQERVVGLVPTMGALHEGHFSLVREGKKQCAPIVVSIFVNPKQFGPGEDLAKYPRTLEADCKALEDLQVDYLFLPSADEMYPPGFRTWVAVEGLSDRLEGGSRPGHFRGVATVVMKLFEIVQPRFAFFGRKDTQQARILRQMAADLDLGTQIVLCPIVREADGLALSSRNAYLKADERHAATALYRSLDAMRLEINAGERDVARLLEVIRGVLRAQPGVQMDYAEIADADKFEPAMALRKDCYALVAARVGGTRLIDNALIEPEGEPVRVTL
ncbi:MAG: pantoate--beta-alanine ligase [Candidatus Acidiferrales bacterium]